ncbi:transposase, partial [Apilactobacillus micheneri]|uniref:transposase n=1 Tax=Apilactobacillus micheneri TaxID=1899430 RepID=UPI003DA709F4
EIIDKILSHKDSINGLSKKYNINRSVIRRWAVLARDQGLMALKVKHTKHNYSIEFKLNVIKYYLTHDLGMNQVASKFNVNPSQVLVWTNTFNKLGLHYCLETVRKLMKKLRLQPTMFNNRCMKKYSSYKGKIGKTHPKIF